MIDQQTSKRPACIDYAAERQRHAAELRQYQEILKAVHAAARTYEKRTGSRINTTDTTHADLAAAAYIIIRESGTRPGETTGDTIRRAAYEAVRRAARDQQRHAHGDLPTDQDAALSTTGEIEAIAIRQAIQQAGHVAQLIAAGWDTSGELSRRLGVSLSTAWRLINRARDQVRQGLDI